jgi:hypothetical protein
MAQMLDLGNETGSPFDEPDGGQGSQADTARNELISRARQQMGL